MSQLNPAGTLLSTYNSLTDKHLADYFRNTRIRRHLQRAGLITRSGRIVPDKEYKHKLIQRAHQRHIRDRLTQAIFHKALEMERIHRIEIKRNLEEFVRRERVHRMKVERSKRYKEDIIPILSPHPPSRVRDPQKQHFGPEEEHSESSESPSSSRPNTAPGKTQRPVRLKPIHSYSTTASLRRSSPYRSHKPPHEDEQLLHAAMDKKPRRHLTTMEASHGILPHYLPVINNFVTPVPPLTKKKEKGGNVPPSSTVRSRRLRPTTSSSGADDPPWLRSSVHQTKVHLNMVYFGKTVHLTNDRLDLRDEVKVFQQHCGGENLCVYKGNLLEGDSFQFISRRHRGFPFSLTFYLNGLQVERLSSCCEFKHSKGSRLGGHHGHFGFSSVEGASPCYKCIIAMGLAKKPTPPPKKEKEENTQKQSANSSIDAPEMKAERTEDDTASHFEPETSQTPDPAAQIQEQTAPGRVRVRDDYEEDFEADDEGPVEEEKSPSPVRETETLVQEENVSETDDDGDDEDTMSRSGSSISSSNREESDAETVKDSTKDEEAGQPKEDDPEETTAPEKNEEPQSDESGAAKVEPTANSADDSTEIEISDISPTSESVNKHGDSSENKSNEEMLHKNKAEDEQDRAKSMQEKLAEAILKESQCSSEPELSDTSTEEEEGRTAKDPQQENKEQEQTVVEETKREEIVTDEVAQEQEESPEAEEEEEKRQPPDSSESIKNEVNEVEEDEKSAERDKSEIPSETQLHADDENVAQDDKTEDLFDGSESASENEEEREKNVVVEADVHTDETGQEAESKKEDESSVLETDESAVTEATATTETMEIKAGASEEQEALSFEEAPETDADTRQRADGEDAAAASPTEVTAEDSSSSPEEAADSTGEKSANQCEETMKDESGEDENKNNAEEQTSGTNEQKDNNEQEEEMEINAKVHENTNKQTSEKEEQAHLNSEEKTDGNMQEMVEIVDGIGIMMDSKVENCTETYKNTTETHNKENEDAAKVLEAANTENTEEENTEDVEDSEYVKNLSEGDDNSHKNENLIETNMVSEEKDVGVGKLEEEEDKDKGAESENEEKDVTGDTLKEGGEMPEMTEKQEKSEDKEKNKICAEIIAESEDVSNSESADETQTAQNVTEYKSDQGEAAEASENEEFNAENGEISFVAENTPNEDEAPAEESSETTGQAKEEPEEATGEESIKGEDMESVEAAEKLEDNITGLAPDTDLTESSTKEADDSGAKHHEPAEEDPEMDISEPGIQELDEKRDNEGTGEGERGETSDPEHKNTALDNIENIDEFVLSEDQERSSAPTDDVGETVIQLDEEKVDSGTNTETGAGAADGENGGAAEEASQASEEGASVLLKPSTQNNVAEQSVIVREETPETLTNKDNTDMVTNWIKMHQSSKYFETFVEPLEDLREDALDMKVSNSDFKETPTTQLARSEWPLNMVKMFGGEEESRVTTQTETEDLENTQDDQYDPVKSAPQGEENHVASNVKPGDVEKDKAQDGPAEETREKTEVESFSGFLKAERVFENQSSEKVTSAGSDLSEKPAAADLPLKTEGFHESESPDVLNNAGQTDNQIRQPTTSSTSKSADGSQEELGGEDVQSERSEDESGETRDVELIKDIKQTFSKDHLSSFSVGRALFPHTSYPLPLTSGTENGP